MFFLLFLFLNSVNAGPFKLQCFPPQVYSGEIFQCEFLYFSELAGVNIEVSKFPEFHGCYKENIGLKQGPIPTFPDPMTLKSAAKIGTYLVYARNEAKSITAQPMEIFLPQKEETLVSEGALPKILPLPPLPKDFVKESFSGAVGEVQRTLVSPNVKFRPGETATLKISILGRFNFYDLSEFPLPADFPLKEIKQKPSFQGSFNFGSKMFEISGIMKENSNVSITSIPFVSFNPRTKQYETHLLGPIFFEMLSPVTDSPSENLTASTETSHRLEWIAALLLGLSAFIIFLWSYYKRTSEKSPVVAPTLPKEKLKPNLEVTEENLIFLYDFLLEKIRKKNPDLSSQSAVEISENLLLEETIRNDFKALHHYYREQFSKNEEKVPFPKEAIERLLEK